MDRAQRLRPRHHADRAVRVDDRHADLPGEPRAGQAPRRAARAARHRASRADGGADERALPAGGAARSSRSRSRRAPPKSATLRTASDESVVFQIAADFSIPPLQPVAYVVERGGQYKTIAVADGAARPQGQDRFPFATPPQVNDALYLGFEEDLASLLVRGRYRRPGCARRGSRPGGSAAAVGGQPGGRWLGRGGRARRPHRRLQLRRRRDRAPMSGGIRGCSHRRQTDAMAAVPDRHCDARRCNRSDLHASARDLLDHGGGDGRSRRRRARRARGRRGYRRQRRHAWTGVSPPLLPSAAAG